MRINGGRYIPLLLPLFLGLWAVPVRALDSGREAAGPDVNRLMEQMPELVSGLEQATLAVRNDGDLDLQRRRLGGEKAPAELHAVVVMCDFSDSLMLGREGTLPGDYPPAAQTEFLFAAHDSVYFHHMLQDVAHYFQAASGGRFTLRFTIFPEVVNLARPMSDYGNDPERGEQPVVLAGDVVDILDPDIDFSDYDTMVLIHAGAGEETDLMGVNPEQISSTYLGPRDFEAAVEDSILPEPWLAGGDFGGTGGLDHVLILPETEYQAPFGAVGSLGVYCFEVGLRLGMLSLSDFTPAGHPDSQGIGLLGLMGYGLYAGAGYIPPQPCAFNKLLMGWIDPVSIRPDQAGSYELTPAGDPSSPTSAARVDINGQEYWLLEYRLQDPDGNNMFSFGDDKNHNGIPDFYDMDSAQGNGIPTGFFDPAVDSLETLVGAEWDFAMSDNPARPRGVNAAGSGVYIWHIDEGVIRDVFDAEGNLFNADPAHKAVDLEEADGIQDLDSTVPSEFSFGGDDDSFRGEGNHEFGPRTRPGTESATGAYTGVVMRNFSKVVADSQGYVLAADGFDTIWGISYADTIGFMVETEAASAEGPVPAARLELPVGVDLRGSDVLIGDLDGGGTPDEIILAGHAGEVYALNGNLREYIDGDGDPATIDPLAIGTWDSQPVTWNLPPAMGDLDGDGLPEIILTAPGGIYAFRNNGITLEPGSEAFRGLYRPLPGCSLPPVLTAGSSGKAAQDEAVQVLINVIAVENGISYLRIYGGDAALAEPGIELGTGRVTAAPVWAFGQAFLCVRADTTGGGDHRLDVIFPGVPGEGGTPVHQSYPLAVEPGPWPVGYGVVEAPVPGRELRYVLVPGKDGSGATLFFEQDMTPTAAPLIWSGDIEVSSPLSPGGCFMGDDLLGRIGNGGDWQDGWPVRVDDRVAVPVYGSPLVARLAGVDSPSPQMIFPLRDGRLAGIAAHGETVPGWPLSGPAACAGTPALGQARGGPLLDLVAVGTFDRITGLSSDTGSLSGDPVSTIMIWEDVAETRAAWPMQGGGIWRNGRYDIGSWTVLSPAAAGAGLVSGSHSCYPNPLREGDLFVRGTARAPGRARAFIYNLEGELVTGTAWRAIAAGDPFTLEVPLDGAVTGMYICRLVVDAGGETDYSVVSFTIVR